MNARSMLYVALGSLSFAISGAMAAPSSVPKTTPPDSSDISADALNRAQTKFAHALRIADQFKDQARAQGITDDIWRFEMVGRLMRGSETDYASVSLARSLPDAMAASLRIANASSKAEIPAQAASSVAAPNSLGSATTDLVYVPITPCRILDTRPNALAALSTQTYSFDSTNAGHAACSVTNQIPGTKAAAAFAVNVTVDETGVSGTGYITLFPQGGSPGGTSFINFTPGQTFANAGIVPVNQSNGQFSLFTSAVTNVIMDAYGVFIAPQPTQLQCQNVATDYSLAANDSGDFFSPTCPSGYSVTSANCYTQQSSGVYLAGNTTGVTGICKFVNTTGATVPVTAGALCCRVPGR